MAAALRAEQGAWEPIKDCISILESNSEPERARVSQRVGVRASTLQWEPEGVRVGVTESHRETGRREGDSKSQ